METTKLPPSSPSSPTTSFSVPSAEKVDGFPRRSMRRARQRRSHSSSQFRYQSSQVELTPLPLLKAPLLPTSLWMDRSPSYHMAAAPLRQPILDPPEKLVVRSCSTEQEKSLLRGSLQRA
ncbi:hypothetical protein KUCAC02_000167, partial [Chaenocephalus aceratus]